VVDDDEEVDDVDADEIDEEEVDEETPPPKSKKSSPSRKRDEDESDEESDEDESLAAAFDSVPTSSNADSVKAGKYEAIVSGVVLQDWDPKGRSIRMKFELCSPDFEGQNHLTKWFKIFDKDRAIQEVGTSIFKQTLARLGYDVPKFNKIKRVLEAINEDRPGVIVKISYTEDKSGNTWQQIVVEGTCDNDVIQEYKDNIPY
jgi:hypothetical protein